MTKTFKTTTTRLALVLGLALTAVAGPALARGDGAGGAGEKGNVMQPMNIQNIQNIQVPPKPPKKKLVRLDKRCGGPTVGSSKACQGGAQL